METEKIQLITNKICEGNFSASDVGILFVWLRPALVAQDPILLDIANFVAHSEGRTKGISFEHVHSYVKNFITVSEKGGTIYGRPPVFKGDEVIQRLVNILKKINLDFDENKFSAQRGLIVEHLLWLMEETKFTFNDPKVVRCYLKRAGSGMMFCLQVNLKSPFIKMSPGAVIQCDLFG